jgi:uncharacterized protein YbjT (DUF2867 family)
LSKILVTGATGFTGSAVVPLLLLQGHSVRCFVRPNSNRNWLPSKGLEWAVGDLGDLDSLVSAMNGAEILVNVASLGFGHAPTIVTAARVANIGRAVFISTTAVLTTLNARSKGVRLAAERLIFESGIASTILRPTMIYGGPRDRNISRLIRFLKISPVIPVFGCGCHQQQPVHVSDVAEALVSCTATTSTVGRTYAVAGPEPVTYDQVIGTVASCLGRKVLKIHLPARPIVIGLGAIESIGLGLPITSEQVRRLEEDKVFDTAPAARDFGYAPKPLLEGVRLEVEEMARRV